MVLKSLTERSAMSEGTVKPFSNASYQGMPIGAVPVDTYSEFSRIVHNWANNDNANLNLIVIGAAGIGKTESALQAVKSVMKPYLYLKGDASRYGVYVQLYNHIDQLVLLDDLDELIRDSGTTGLLKMLLETRPIKTIQRTTANSLKNEMEGEGVPSSFETKSRACLLVNEISQVSKNFGACLDRATIIYFAPNAKEVTRYVKTWFDMAHHKDVFDFVAERLPLAVEPSCRYFYKAVTWKESGIDWKSMIERQMTPNDSRVVVYRELQQDKTYKTDKARIEEWCKRTGYNRGTYFAIKKAVSLKDGTLSQKSQNISRAQKARLAAKKKK
jgi:hypothetical protein